MYMFLLYILDFVIQNKKINYKNLLYNYKVPFVAIMAFIFLLTLALVGFSEKQITKEQETETGSSRRRAELVGGHVPILVDWSGVGGGFECCESQDSFLIQLLIYLRGYDRVLYNLQLLKNKITALARDGRRTLISGPSGIQSTVVTCKVSST